MRTKLCALIVAGGMLLGGMTWAEVRLPKLISDGMVLQRDAEVRLWGWAADGEKVRVAFNGQEAAATAKDGQWRVILKPMKAGGPWAMTIMGKNQIVLPAVYVGEVWMAAGQSNMQIQMKDCWPEAEKNKILTQPTNELIRFFIVPGQRTESPAPDVGNWAWQACSPKTAPYFSAVAYYFARDLQAALKIPVGVFVAAAGATRIECWTSRETVDANPVNAPFLAEAAAGRIKAKWMPYGLFNGMIAPVTPYAIRGALWYQGEANGNEGEPYAWKMRALIGGWRKLWQQGEFPFYYVQLPNIGVSKPDRPAGGDGWAKIREAQFKALSIPNTGMAITIDIGEAKNIHPKNKQDVGKRLAALALANHYQKKTVPGGPLYQEHKIEGGKIRITFANAGPGLMVGKKAGLEPVKNAEGEKLQWFAVAGADKVWQWADAVIDGQTVVVSSDKAPAPVAVRYAFTANPEGAYLYNKDGFPASPFRTDNW